MAVHMKMNKGRGHNRIILESMDKLIIGVDEAGRGALAGPVCVGAVLMSENFDWRKVFALITKRGEPKLRDSKQLSAEKRSILYECITKHASLKYASSLVDARTIDSVGIAPATRQATLAAVLGLGIAYTHASLLLDAGLSLPKEWRQESFVRGDETIPVISLASMIAKVTRDRYMEGLATSHAGYGFEVHKGYGTAAHMKAIREKGLSSEHRQYFVHI